MQRFRIFAGCYRIYLDELYSIGLCGEGDNKELFFNILAGT